MLWEGDDVHVWVPRGHFTVHRSGEATWRTSDEPLREFARAAGDADVHLPPAAEAAARLDGSILDALVTPSGALVVVVEGAPPRVRVFERPGGPLQFELSLVADGPACRASRTSGSPAVPVSPPGSRCMTARPAGWTPPRRTRSPRRTAFSSLVFGGRDERRPLTARCQFTP